MERWNLSLQLFESTITGLSLGRVLGSLDVKALSYGTSGVDLSANPPHGGGGEQVER
jgi:hypothetical protein